MSTNFFKSGEWNVICDVCSRKIKSGEAQHRWDGFITCKDCWEPRHPMDFIKARVDKISVPFQRPIPPNVFIPSNFEARFEDSVLLNENINITKETATILSDTATVSDGTIIMNIIQDYSLDSMSLNGGAL